MNTAIASSREKPQSVDGGGSGWEATTRLTLVLI